MINTIITKNIKEFKQFSITLKEVDLFNFTECIAPIFKSFVYATPS